MEVCLESNTSTGIAQISLLVEHAGTTGGLSGGGGIIVVSASDVE